MVLSKLGNIESAQATEYLTSTLNGFKLEAKDSMDVISKIVSLDNAFATSAGEISSALQRSSVSAQQAGVNFDELAAMITVVSDVSRRAPESIGESFKTMFARFQDILAGAVDEEGMGINNVGKALERVGISIRDTEGGFRDFSDVLDDLYPIWDKLNEVEQANILKALAGTRQRESLLVLLENETKYRQALEVQMDSEGKAMERYAEYLDSAEAAQNRMNASWEKLAQTAISGGLVSSFYNATAKVLDFADAIGGIPPILAVVGASLIAFNLTTITTATGVYSLATAWTFLTGVLKASNPIGWVVLGIGAAIFAMNYFNETTVETVERIKGLQTEVDNLNGTISKLNKQKSTLSDLWAEYDTLKKKTGKSADEQERFYSVQEKIREILPEISGYYDEQGRFMLDEATNLKALIDLKNEELAIEKEKLAIANKKASSEAIEAYRKSKEEIDRIQGGSDYATRHNYVSEEENLKRLEELALAQKTYMHQIKTNYMSIVDETEKEVFLNTLKMGDAIDQQIAKQLEEIATVSSDVTPAEALLPSTDDIDKAKEGMESLINTVINMIKQKKEAEKEALQDQLDNIKDEIDAQKEYYKIQMEEVKRVASEKKKAAQRELAEIKRNFEVQQDSIKAQLEAYEKIIDAQKKSLDLQKQEADYNREKEEKQSNLSDLEARIAALMFDTSEAGIAERLRLEEEAAKLRAEIAQDEADRAYELQVDALDAELEMAQQEADIQLSQIEAAQQQAELEYELLMNRLEDEEYAAERSYEIYTSNLDAEYDAQKALLESQIDAIDEYLKQEGTIRRDAMAMIADENSNLYQELLDWNKAYGSGIDEDIINMWNTAIGKVEEYAQALSEIPDTPNTPTGNPALDDWFNDEPTTSSSSSSTSSNPALDDWWNDGQSSQINAIMQRNAPPTMGATPQTTSTSVGNSASVGNLMNFNVSGNLDSSVIPSIEKIANEVMNKINNINLMRGNKRSSVLFSG